MQSEIKYWKVTVPPTRDMSEFKTNARESTLETKEENALWDYNHARAHDGLRPLKNLPDKTKFEPVYNT